MTCVDINITQSWSYRDGCWLAQRWRFVLSQFIKQSKNKNILRTICIKTLPRNPTPILHNIACYEQFQLWILNVTKYTINFNVHYLRNVRGNFLTVKFKRLFKNMKQSNTQNIFYGNTKINPYTQHTVQRNLESLRSCLRAENEIPTKYEEKNKRTKTTLESVRRRFRSQVRFNHQKRWFVIFIHRSSVKTNPLTRTCETAIVVRPERNENENCNFQMSMIIVGFVVIFYGFCIDVFNLWCGQNHASTYGR